jgi:hypothetical protein
MVMAYLAVCLPLLGPDFCYQEKQLPNQFDTTEACWAAVEKFMDDVKPGVTTITYHWRCGEDT